MPVVLALAFVVAAVVVAVTVYALRPSRRRTGSPAPPAEDAELAELERSPDPLLRTVARLTRRIGLAERFNRRLQFLLRVLLAVVGVLVVLAVVVVGLVVATRHQSDQRDLDQADARYAGCVQYNVAQTNTREAIVKGLIGGFQPLVPPERAADLDYFAAVLRRSVEDQLPYRDCSPSGIDRYLSHPPPDPARTTTTTVPVPPPPSSSSGG